MHLCTILVLVSLTIAEARVLFWGLLPFYSVASHSFYIEHSRLPAASLGGCLHPGSLPTHLCILIHSVIEEKQQNLVLQLERQLPKYTVTLRGT